MSTWQLSVYGCGDYLVSQIIEVLPQQRTLLLFVTDVYVCIHPLCVCCLKSIDFVGTYGKSFNNQEVIWIGHAPILNKTDIFHGYMTGK